MKTKRIIVKCFMALIVFVSLSLSACNREEWCWECIWICDGEPLFGPSEKEECYHSSSECETEMQDFWDSRFLPDCWECTVHMHN